MRACVQRVSRARVTLPEEGNRISGQIDRGFLVLLGIGQKDGIEEVRLLARKICRLRVFDDAEGKMNLDLTQVGGKILAVSQFTLYADTARGHRPGFTDAAPPDRAKRLYEEFIAEVRETYSIPVETGVFQTMMNVELVNDGPVTIWLDTDQWGKKE